MRELEGTDLHGREPCPPRLPSPVEAGPIKATEKGKEVELAPDPDGPLAALVFKTHSEQHLGDLAVPARAGELVDDVAVEPLIPLRLFRDSVFNVTGLVGLVIGVAYLWAWIGIPGGLYGTIWILALAFIAYGVTARAVPDLGLGVHYEPQIEALQQGKAA